MSTWRSCTARISSARTLGQIPRLCASAGRPAFKRAFRPLTLGLIGLALAVTLWGFAYKISLYSDPADPLPHLPVAKVWIEHRYGYAVEFKVAAVDQQPVSNLDFGPQVLTNLLYPLLLQSRRTIFDPPPKQGAGFYHSSLSPRAPPSLG
jgi:hypothetical protein